MLLLFKDLQCFLGNKHKFSRSGSENPGESIERSPVTRMLVGADYRDTMLEGENEEQNTYMHLK